MRICKNLFTLLCVIFLWVNVASAANKILSLVDGTDSHVITGNVGDTVVVEVHIDDAASVAGASFTVTYDTDNLSLNSVTSTFFKTFVLQGLLNPPEDLNYITVDGVKYYRPLVSNDISTGTMIAAARFDNGGGTDVNLFNLSFELTGVPGTYPISIIASTIDNEAAGYAPGGETIPLLVGIDGDSYPTHNVTSVIEANITIFIDIDGDGIDDNWEIAHIPPGTPAGTELNVFTATGDYDHDGYSDLQEYLNRGELDPDDQTYDPVVINAPGGPGYVPPTNPVNPINPAINLLLLRN